MRRNANRRRWLTAGRTAACGRVRIECAGARRQALRTPSSERRLRSPPEDHAVSSQLEEAGIGGHGETVLELGRHRIVASRWRLRAARHLARLGIELEYVL